MTVAEREGLEEVEGLRLPLPDTVGVGLEDTVPEGLALPLVHWDTVPVALRVKVGEVLPVRLPLGLAVLLRVPEGHEEAEGEPLPVPPAPAALTREAEPERDLLPVPL